MYYSPNYLKKTLPSLNLITQEILGLKDGEPDICKDDYPGKEEGKPWGKYYIWFKTYHFVKINEQLNERNKVPNHKK